MNKLSRFVWSRIFVYDFWSISLAMIKTSEIFSRKLGWIRDDNKSVWYNTLYSVTFSIIRQFAVICVDAPATNNACVLLQDLLHSIPTFKSSFEELTFACKSLILIDNSLANLGQINLEIHEYELYLEVAIPPHNKTTANSLHDILLPSACTCAAFVNIATKNKIIYKQTAKEEETNIQKY